MAKQATTQKAAAASGTKRKVLRKLEKARADQQKAERKVGNLRVRLEQAELKLSKRAQRLGTLQARLQAAGDSAAKQKPAQAKKSKDRAAQHERLAAIGLAEPEEISGSGATLEHIITPGGVTGEPDGAANGAPPASTSEAAHDSVQMRKSGQARAQRNRPEVSSGTDQLPAE